VRRGDELKGDLRSAVAAWSGDPRQTQLHGRSRKEILDAGKKAIAAAQDFSKACNKQLDDYYSQYIKPKGITAPEKDWDRDVKDLDQLITAMQKAGKFWHGEV
jgi:hypothetical protein